MAVNKVTYGGETLIDLTGDTVTADKLAEGITAHDASGAEIIGTLVASAQKVAVGTMTKSSYTGTISITHGLGVTPNLAVIYGAGSGINDTIVCAKNKSGSNYVLYHASDTTGYQTTANVTMNASKVSFAPTYGTNGSYTYFKGTYAYVIGVI